MDVDKPDEKSIMTYVAKFLEKYPDPDMAELQSDDPKVGDNRGLYNYVCPWMDGLCWVYNLSGCHILK